MSICDELKKQAEQTYAEGIDKSIETAAACFRLCAEGLSRFSDDGGGSYPIQDISLLIACSAVSGGWNSVSSADRERMSERLKLYVSNINGLCDDLPLALTVPGYANIGRNLMSPPQITAFTEHLMRLFQTLGEHEKMAAAENLPYCNGTVYCVVSLFYGTIIGIVVYRIVTILAVFIINLLYRRRNAKKAAALRAGNYIP